MYIELIKDEQPCPDSQDKFGRGDEKKADIVKAMIVFDSGLGAGTKWLFLWGFFQLREQLYKHQCVCVLVCLCVCPRFFEFPLKSKT
jgi:hypothetical protein